jgi:hemolysin activation/secretion protein
MRQALASLTPLILIGGLALGGLPVAAQPVTQAAQVHFPLLAIELEGAHLITPAQWQAAVAPYLSAQADFNQLDEARKAIEAIYHRQGWRLAQVQLPAQTLEGGVVRMSAVEFGVSRVEVRGAAPETLAHWLAALPALVPGESPNLSALDTQLALLNDGVAQRVRVAFVPDAQALTLTAQVQVEPAPASGWSAHLDNRGDAQTGRLRYGLSWHHDNLWDARHRLNLQVESSPHSPGQPDQITLEPSHRVKILSLNYAVPLPHWSAQLEGSLGYSNVDSGLVQNIFDIRGTGLSTGIKFSQWLDRWQGWEPRWSAGLEVRHIDSQVLFGGINLAAPLDLHPLSLGVAMRRNATPQQPVASSLYATLVANIAGGEHGGDASFAASRAGATPHYQLLRMGAAVATQWNTWDLSAVLDAQYSPHLLVAAEQFSAGGAHTVRGFAERGIAGDSGLRLQLEAMAPGWGDAAAGVRPLVFMDAAQAQLNLPSALEQGRSSIASLGLGLRGHWGRTTWRLDLARAIHQDTGAPQVQGGMHFWLHVPF